VNGDDTGREPTDDIMCATYRALCRHGYADLTMQDIADEWSKSKSALLYHYDTKRDLLLAVLEHLYESYTDRVEAPEAGTPRDRLVAVIDAALTGHGSEACRQLRTALFEVSAQAPYDEAFRERLQRFDRHLADEVEALVTEGVASGQFRDDADVEAVTTLLVTVVQGAHSRRIALATDDDVAAAARAYVDDHLVDRTTR
jgi:AcrR family transcriptional regulator